MKKNINYSLASVLALLFISALPSYSQNIPAAPRPGFTREELKAAKANPKYYTINPASVKITLMETAQEPDMSYVKLQEDRDPAATPVSLDSIINTAQKVWAIVEANQPIANIETKYATAYPEGVTSAAQLSGWSKPISHTYGFSAQNGFGSTMINSQYKVIFTYGGNYKGKGKYLTAIAVIPVINMVGSGYKFSMAADAPDSTLMNVGTDTDPVAAIQLKLAWKITTVLKEDNGTSMYYMQGDGDYEEMASPFGAKEVKLEDMKSGAALLNPEKVFDVPAR